jgi:Fe-S-cluster containining protein
MSMTASEPGVGLPCARCAKALGRSCCEVREGETLAMLTAADVNRLQAATGLPRARIVEEEWLTWEEARRYEERRPLYRGYFREAPLRVTLQIREGACVFFAPGKGCTLPVAARPVPCRLYPFEPTESGRLMVTVDIFPSMEEAAASSALVCLAVQEVDDWEGLLAAFRTNREELRALFLQLRSEIESPRR